MTDIRRGRLHIGTSGWHYRHWKNSFYEGRPASQWLAFYARHFNSVEINASFYRDPSPSTLRQWHDTTPGDFRFTIKGHRYISHVKRLHDAGEAIAREKNLYQALRNKLAIIVWQLPVNFHINIPRLEAFCGALQAWREVRHAIEFRHDSWFGQDTMTCLQENQIAVCQSDAADWPLWDSITTDLVYIRLHGHSRTYASAYSPRLLGQWRQYISRCLHHGNDVYVYFDNDAEGAAPRDALRLQSWLAGDADSLTAPSA